LSNYGKIGYSQVNKKLTVVAAVVAVVAVAVEINNLTTKQQCTEN